MGDPAVEVYLDTELVHSYSQLPTYDALVNDLTTALNKNREEFQVTLAGSGTVVQNSEDLELTQRPIQLQIVLISGFCLFCSKALLLGTTLCDNCKTENWDKWLEQKYGSEQLEKMMDAQPKLTPAFSFGPNVQIQGQKPKVFDAAKEGSECSKGSGELSLKDLDRGSQQDSQPDSRRDFPQQDDSTLDRMVVPSESTYELKSVLEKKESGRDSGEFRMEDLIPKRSDSPVQVPGNRRAHDRHHCKICQGRNTTSGRSSGDYYTEYFHEFQAQRTETRPLARMSSDAKSSLELRTVAWKESRQRTRRSYGLPETAESLQKCQFCWSEFPWYQDTCPVCEVRRSLARHPDSSYKHRVQKWC